MDFESIERSIDRMVDKQNNRAILEFEGYSLIEMQHLLCSPFEEKSPIKLQKLNDAEYAKIPLLNMVKYFLNLLKKEEEIKLTAKGFLPTKFVKEIYSQGFIEERMIAEGISKLYKESDPKKEMEN